MAKKKSSKRLELTERGGYWTKRRSVNGKVQQYNFSAYKGEPYEAALARYLQFKAFYDAGHPIPEEAFGDPSDLPTLGTLIDHFLPFKEAEFRRRKRLPDNDPVNTRQMADLRTACDDVAAVIDRDLPLKYITEEMLGKVRSRIEKNQQGEFISPLSINRKLGNIKSLLQHASNNKRFIDDPLPYRDVLKKEAEITIERHKGQRDEKDISREELLQAIESATPLIRLCILFGILGGYNNSDLAHLHIKDVNHSRDWLDYRRAKNSRKRLARYWPEMQKAVQDYIAVRPDSKRPELLLTPRSGHVPFHTFDLASKRNCKISRGFNRLVNEKLGIWRPGMCFSSTRSVFGQVALQSANKQVTQAAMGHKDGSVLFENYAHNKVKEMLTDPFNHVHAWLYDYQCPCMRCNFKEFQQWKSMSDEELAAFREWQNKKEKTGPK